jgi:hypothetical protein
MTEKNTASKYLQKIDIFVIIAIIKLISCSLECNSRNKTQLKVANELYEEYLIIVEQVKRCLSFMERKLNYCVCNKTPENYVLRQMTKFRSLYFIEDSF